MSFTAYGSLSLTVVYPMISEKLDLDKLVMLIIYASAALRWLLAMWIAVKVNVKIFVIGSKFRSFIFNINSFKVAIRTELYASVFDNCPHLFLVEECFSVK